MKKKYVIGSIAIAVIALFLLGMSLAGEPPKYDNTLEEIYKKINNQKEK